MAKDKNVVITGAQRQCIDAAVVARVIIRLAHDWWLQQNPSTDQTAKAAAEQQPTKQQESSECS